MLGDLLFTAVRKQLRRRKAHYLHQTGGSSSRCGPVGRTRRYSLKSRGNPGCLPVASGRKVDPRGASRGEVTSD